MKPGILTVLLLFLAAVPAWAQSLRIITENSPPLNYTEDGAETGKLIGQAVEIVREIQKRLQDTTAIEVMPWARGYALIQAKPNVMLFSMARTEDREGLFQWVGPVGANDWVFVARKGSSLVIKSLDDARKVGGIGVYKNDARDLFLRAQGFTNIDSANDPAAVLRKLLSGRDDLWCSTNVGYVAVARASQVDPSTLVPLFTVKKAELYLAFSKGVEAGTVGKWRKAYEEIKADGTYAKILAKWAK